MEMEGNRFVRRMDRWMAWGIAIALFIYIWLRIGPDLLYFSFGTYCHYPRFETGGAFFYKTIGLSGGLILYIGGFLSQLFVVPWLGAAAVGSVLGLVYLAVRELPWPYGTFRRWIGWTPVILLVMVWQQYDHPMTLVLGLAVNLGMAAAVLRLRLSRWWLRAAVFLAAMALLYWWTAAICMVFAIVVVTEIILVQRRVVEGIILGVLAGGLMWVLGTRVFYLEPTAVWLRLTPFYRPVIGEWTGLSRTLAVTAFVIVPAVYGLVGLLQRIGIRKKNKPAVHHRGKTVQPSGRLRLVLSVGWRMAFVAAAGWGLRYSYQVNELSVKNPLALKAGQAARVFDWQGVIEAATELKRRGNFPRTVIHDVDRALSHLGQLGDRMFEFPQETVALLYYNIQETKTEVWYDKVGGLMFDMGYMNSVEQLTTEILEQEGPIPFVLDRLAWAARIKRRDAEARVFEAALARQIAHRLSRALRPGADGTVEISDARFDELARLLPTKDHEVRDTGLDELMLDLLDNHPKNRMAFDYLMAYYLLTFQQDKTAAQFVRLKELGFQRLPRHYAEAALIAQSKAKGPIDLMGWPIDPEIIKRYQAFTQQARALRTHPDREAIFVREFGDSYLYYSAFGQSRADR